MSGKIRSSNLLSMGLLAATVLFGWAGLASAQTPNAVFNALGLTPESNANSQGEGVSADGKIVVGFYNTWSPRGYVWDFNTGTAAELNARDSFSLESNGWCLSANGQFAAGRGWYEVAPGDHKLRPFFWSWTGGVWEPSVMPSLLGGQRTFSQGWNHVYGMTPDASILVGVSEDGQGIWAVRWIAAVADDGSRTWAIETLGDLPGGSIWGEAFDCSADGGIIVGHSEFKPNAQFRPFRWENGVMAALSLLKNDKYGGAWACSADGSRIVGESRGNGERGVLWAGGKITAIPDLPGGATANEATNISPDGRFIVGWGTSAIGTEAYIYDTATGTLNTIKALLQSQGNVLPAGWIPQFAADVTDLDANGQVTVVGRGLNPQGKIEGYRAVITPQ